ncbi:hypothetical protein ACHAXA_010824 [Cyclostephanos tholiformis]|uniref:Uncharacterized protein n=1 Tax=Cyclostephanos tholiformis TaxID=382380 RepID=A0ABD3SG17_9STRA
MSNIATYYRTYLPSKFLIVTVQTKLGAMDRWRVREESDCPTTMTTGTKMDDKGDGGVVAAISATAGKENRRPIKNHHPTDLHEDIDDVTTGGGGKRSRPGLSLSSSSMSMSMSAASSLSTDNERLDISFDEHGNNLEEEEEEEEEEEILLEGVRLRYCDEDNVANDDSNTSASDDDDCRDIDDSDMDDDDDDRSEGSGDTVEINRLYWEWCYGPILPDAVVVAAGNYDDDAIVAGGSKSIHRSSVPAKSWERHHQASAVKFGNNTAAEFDSLLPITYMTPIPDSVVLRIFPLEKDGEKTSMEMEAMEGESRETARNVATLAEWDDDFDGFVDDDVYDIEDEMVDADENDVGGRGGVGIHGNGFRGGRPSSGALTPGGRTMKRGRKRTPYKDGRGSRHVGSSSSGMHGSRRRGGGSSSSSRRRESSLFSSRGGRGRRSLIDPNDDGLGLEKDSGMCDDGGLGNDRDSLLPFSVTIDAGDYASPSSTSLAGNSVSTLGTPIVASLASGGGGSTLDAPEGDGTMPPPTTHDPGSTTRNSMNSACVSPGSFVSSLSSSTGRDGEDRVRQESDSAFVVGRRGSVDVASGKATPNSARTSSSTILRAVHASGAFLPSNSPGVRGDDFGGPSDGDMREQKAILSLNVKDANCVGDGDGRLRPNHLKYSPSSGSVSFDTLLGESLTSPSDSNGSLSSDIMSLFIHQSLDNTSHYGSKTNSDLFHLGKQLSILSEHPFRPFYISICDLIHWSYSSTHRDKKLLEFTSEVLSNGLSPSTTLSLVVDDMTNYYDDWDVNDSKRSMSDHFKILFSGTSRGLQSALFTMDTKFSESSSLVKKTFESILMEEIQNLSHPSDTHQGWSRSAISKMVDADLHSLSSSIQKHYTASCLDWSWIEVHAANRALVRLQTWAASMNIQTRERDKFITTSCHKMLKESTPMIIHELAQVDLKRRKRKVESKLEEVRSEIASLEDQLAVEVDRLERSMRAKQLLDAHLRLERFSPISALNEEIRWSISPSPIVVGNGLSQFSFRLLNGSVEIVMEVSSDDENDTDTTVCGSGISRLATSKVLELGCFIKDGGSPIKLLQAILLGNVKMSVNESMGPYLLRSSLSSFIRDEPSSRQEIFHRSSLIFSRIDSLVRSVRELEVEGSTCNVIENGANIILSISMPKSDMGVAQIDFLFVGVLHDAWNISNLVPNHVEVSIISSAVGADLSLLRNHMQDKARSMILGKSISAEPILLRRICVETNRMLNVV